MQAVGRIGSYISRSVYTVSGPFHPFGGAVDIIVVEQPDGSYKSSPWYVRFGKFQGVLKSKEKVVSISVNGVDADFHMYLDHKGEAFFLREVDVEEGESAFSPPSSSGEDMEGQFRNRWPLKSKSCNFDSSWSESVGNDRKAVTRDNSSRPQFLGFVFGRRSALEEGVKVKEDPTGVDRSESLELAEFTADLLELKWSTNLDSPWTKRKKDNLPLSSAADAPKNGVKKKFSAGDCCHNETDHVSQTSYQEMESTSGENGVEIKSSTLDYSAKTDTSVASVKEGITLSNTEPLMTDAGKSDFQVSSVCMVSEVVDSDSQNHESVEKLNGLDKEDQFSFVHKEKVSVSGGATCGTPGSTAIECYSRLVCIRQSNDSFKNTDSRSIAVPFSSSHSTCSLTEEQDNLGEKDKHEFSKGHLCDPHSCDSLPSCTQASSIVEEELFFGDLDDCGSSDAIQMEVGRHSDHAENETDCLSSSRDADVANESSDAKCRSILSLDQSIVDDYFNDAGVQRTRLCPVASDACLNEKVHDHSKGFTRMAMSLPSMASLSNTLEASECPGVSSVTNNNHQSAGAQTPIDDAEILKESKGEPANLSLGGSSRKWPFPFRRSRGRAISLGDVNGGIEPLNKLNDSERVGDVPNVKVSKKKERTLTPTSEQLASLNLKEGKNVVIFTFSTSMLGNQQVDARIFLWRWDTQIVISDVDGTITRSDLLGQVMPLVGMDWSQTGVAHLFSAIKENGYQVLFLSARSISQSSITRQFLFNIIQDGKALPDGPVVISPDGLFPSLFREVVRRAPHEFKISCLEDIKALFPRDRNPFYAGFGNRDTDEFSYLKVGIPRGKIFIINPKGEIAVNRRVDTKSYSSLHTLVHGMFPTMSTCEQEDFNSWNYWKLPPPMIDL